MLSNSSSRKSPRLAGALRFELLLAEGGGSTSVTSALGACAAGAGGSDGFVPSAWARRLRSRSFSRNAFCFSLPDLSAYEVPSSSEDEMSAGLITTRFSIRPGSLNGSIDIRADLVPVRSHTLCE